MPIFNRCNREQCFLGHKLGQCQATLSHNTAHLY